MIPEVPQNCIAYIDGYGNLKTTIPQGALGAPPGTVLRVRIGRVERDAVLSEGNFAVEPGRLACAPGSSGWRDASGSEQRWMELFLRGGNAWDAFGQPPIGERLWVTDTL